MNRLVCILLLALFWATPAPALETAGIKALQLAKSPRSWNGQSLPAYPSGQPEVTILRITIPPGAKLPRHQHPVINAGVLLKGELTVVADNGQTLHLTAGDPIVEVVDNWHYGSNEGTEAAEIIVFYAGAAGTPVTVQEEAAR